MKSFSLPQNNVAIVLKNRLQSIIQNKSNRTVTAIPFNRPKQLKNEPVKLNKSAKKVLQALKTNPESTIDEIAKSISVSRETVKRSLKSLSEKGLIKRVSSDKTGYWEIIE